MFYAEKPRQQKSQWCKRHLHLSCPRRIPGQGVIREGKGCWQEEGKWYRERNADSLGWAFSPVPTWTSRASPCGDQSGPWGVWFSSSTAFSCSGKKTRSDTETQILGLEIGQSIQKSLRNTGKSFRTSTTCGLHTQFVVEPDPRCMVYRILGVCSFLHIVKIECFLRVNIRSYTT